MIADIYKDIRLYLIQALEIDKPERIVRSYQNNVPIPQNAIIMNFRQSQHIDQHSTAYDDNNNMIVFNSVRGFMQVDFYGDGSYDLAQQISTLWNSPYTTNVLKNCVPLSTPQIRDLTFVNEQSNYELRYMLDLELEYNTSYSKSVKMISDISQIDSEFINGF